MTTHAHPQKKEMSTQDWIAIVGVALGAFMAILDIQIINASLRDIQGSLNLDMSESGWISTAYLIAEIIVIPLTAFLSSVFGVRRYIIFNSIVFVIASCLCGVSWDLTSMIVFRILQGISGGTLIPMSFQTILTVMPAHKRNIGLAIFGMTATLAPTLGPSVGGWLTASYGWRSIFFINILPGIITTVCLYYGLEKSKANFSLLRKMDVSGTISLAVALGTLTYILEEGASHSWFEDPIIRKFTLVFIISMGAFLAIQITKENPLLNLKLLLDRNFGTAGIITMLTAVGLYGGVYATSVYLGAIQMYSSQDIGKVMMWIGIPQIFIMPLVPFLLNRIDARILAVFGMLIFAFSNYLNIFLSSNYAGEQFRISLILRAIGQPLFMIPLSSMAMGMIPAREVGNASAIYNVLRNLGGSIGIALTTTVLVERGNSHLAHHLNKISLADIQTAMNYNIGQRMLMQRGLDKLQSAQLLNQGIFATSYREALIMAFSDSFYIMAVFLAICTVLILVLKPNKSATMHFE